MSKAPRQHISHWRDLSEKSKTFAATCAHVQTRTEVAGAQQEDVLAVSLWLKERTRYSTLTCWHLSEAKRLAAKADRLGLRLDVA